MNHADSQAGESALEFVVREALLHQTAKLSDTQVIAFLDGWSTALDLIRRTDLILPGAPPLLKQAIVSVVETIRQVQYEVLAERE